MLGRQDILTIHADKDVKRPHNREDRSSQLQEKTARENGPEMGQKSPVPADLGGPARPIFVVVRAPLWTRVASEY
jgi:hypothetical protein